VSVPKEDVTERAARIDELVRAILPRNSIPSHVRPAHLLDDDVVPPPRISSKVLALRELLRSGGRLGDLVDTAIATSRDVAEYYQPRLCSDVVESLHIAGLDAKNRVLLSMCVARGGVASCAVTPRDILRPLVLNACVSGIVVHNHPSGDPQPSAADIALTDQLKRGADVLGVRLLDHIVIGASGYFSFLDAGLLAHLGTPSSEG
jgi:DNA repair protein RadC